MIKLKRVYECPATAVGIRVLIDRLWPRGLTKERARVDVWQRDLAPSDELRQWYGHDRARFSRYRARYRMELFRDRDALATLAIQGERKTLTLLHSAADSGCSNAAVLKELLEEVLNAGRPPPGRRSPAVPKRSAARSTRRGEGA
jgi:uncharacterized protein YeaO (DUF488 family)